MFCVLPVVQRGTPFRYNRSIKRNRLINKYCGMLRANTPHLHTTEEMSPLATPNARCRTWQKIEDGAWKTHKNNLRAVLSYICLGKCVSRFVLLLARRRRRQSRSHKSVTASYSSTRKYTNIETKQLNPMINNVAQVRKKMGRYESSEPNCIINSKARITGATGWTVIVTTDGSGQAV